MPSGWDFLAGGLLGHLHVASALPRRPGKGPVPWSATQSQAKSRAKQTLSQLAACLSAGSWTLEALKQGGQHGKCLLNRNLLQLCHRVPRPALRAIPGFHRQPHRPRTLSPSPWLHLTILETRTQGHITRCRSEFSMDHCFSTT